MRVIKIVVGRYETNTYLYYDTATLEGAIIDPGDEAELIIKEIIGSHMNVKAILLTHGHQDHINAVEQIKAQYNVPVYAYIDEAALLSAAYPLKLPGYGENKPLRPDAFFNDGDIFKVGGGVLEVIHTPGHTAGSCSFYDKQSNLLFSGDALFYGSIGRTDLPTGDYDTLIRSIRRRIYTLPDETKVLPGHGSDTSVGFEKAKNPFVNEMNE